MTGGIVALNENPDQYDKLRNNHDLIYSMVPEIIRWQTPLAYMRRTALEDTEIRGKKIKKKEKLINVSLRTLLRRCRQIIMAVLKMLIALLTWQFLVGLMQ